MHALRSPPQSGIVISYISTTNLVSRIHGASEVVPARMIQEPAPGDCCRKTTGCSLDTSNIHQEVPLLVVAIQLKSTSTSLSDSPSVSQHWAALITLSLCIDMTLTALLQKLTEQTTTTTCPLHCLDRALRTLIHTFSK